MGKSTLEKMENEAKKLTPQEQLKLVEKLVHQLRKTDIDKVKELDWGELYGLGKKLWKEEGSQKYQ